MDLKKALEKIDWVPGFSFDLDTDWAAARPCTAYLVFYASVSSSVKWAYPTQKDCWKFWLTDVNTVQERRVSQIIKTFSQEGFT